MEKLFVIQNETEKSIAKSIVSWCDEETRFHGTALFSVSKFDLHFIQRLAHLHRARHAQVINNFFLMFSSFQTIVSFHRKVFCKWNVFPQVHFNEKRDGFHQSGVVALFSIHVVEQARTRESTATATAPAGHHQGSGSHSLRKTSCYRSSC